MIVRFDFEKKYSSGHALHIKIFYEYIFLGRHRENETTEC